MGLEPTTCCLRYSYSTTELPRRDMYCNYIIKYSLCILTLCNIRFNVISMANTIKCSNCGNLIDVGEQLAHDIKDSIILEERKKAQQEIDEVRKKMSNDMSKLLDEIKNLRERDEMREVEMKKKLLENEENIKLEAKRKFEEEHQLKDVEKDKLINDLKKSLEDAQKKAVQGSQQTQGEVLELTIERKLKEEYPQDEINEVKKGVRGADVIQKVFDKNGNACGSIIWESKNAKWSETWLSKLKEDQRQAKADLAVLVSSELPENIKQKGLGYKNGVWIVSVTNFLSLSMSLRFNLVNIYHEKENLTSVDEKMKVLYKYLTGQEFKLRVEGIVESFGLLLEDIEKEKRWFTSKWARQEKEIRKVIDHTHGMYGDLQGVTGRNLPEIKSLQLGE